MSCHQRAIRRCRGFVAPEQTFGQGDIGVGPCRPWVVVSDGSQHNDPASQATATKVQRAATERAGDHWPEPAISEQRLEHGDGLRGVTTSRPSDTDEQARKLGTWQALVAKADLHRRERRGVLFHDASEHLEVEAVDTHASHDTTSTAPLARLQGSTEFVVDRRCQREHQRR